jgi:hypothetical protein
VARPCTIRQRRASDPAELIAAKKTVETPMSLYDQICPSEQFRVIFPMARCGQWGLKETRGLDVYLARVFPLLGRCCPMPFALVAAELESEVCGTAMHAGRRTDEERGRRAVIGNNRRVEVTGLDLASQV